MKEKKKEKTVSPNAESIRGLGIVLTKLKENGYKENHLSVVAVKKQLESLK